MNIEGQCHFFTLARGHLYMNIKFAFLRNDWAIFNHFHMSAGRYKFMKIHQHNAGHMAKPAAMTIYGKNTFKIYFQETTGPILMNPCMRHQRQKPIIFCSNYDPGLTLTYITAR